MTKASLQGRRIAISISDTPDMGVLGLGKEHLEDAMTEIARHLLACDARLAYGGDLRPGGFTELLFELVNRYRRNEQVEQGTVRNYLAWPVHVSTPRERIEEWEAALEGVAELVLLNGEGKEMAGPEKSGPREPTPSEWMSGLTAMRQTMASHTYARVVLGGRTSGFRGRLPGIAEEALIQIENKAPLYLLAGFGGCSLDIARAMELEQTNGSARWNGLDNFARYRVRDLRNGLTDEENRALARTVHADEAAALILRGLLRTLDRDRARA